MTHKNDFEENVMNETPGTAAYAYIQCAQNDFDEGLVESAGINLNAALSFEGQVRGFRDMSWDVRRENHVAFTETLIGGCVLSWKLANTERAVSLYKAALVWADDDLCTSDRLHTLLEIEWRLVTRTYREYGRFSSWKRRYVRILRLFASVGFAKIQKNESL